MPVEALHGSGSRPQSGGEYVGSGMVRLVAQTGRLRPLYVTFIINGAIDRTGSVGGWQNSERVLREDADWWKGIPKGQLSIPCLLDHYAQSEQRTLEQRLRDLYDMGQPERDDDPPQIHVYGDVPMSHPPAWVWKLDDIQLGANLFREDHPSRLRRQELTLQLSTWRPATAVSRGTVKRTRDKTGNHRRRRVVVAHARDTLRAIAVRELGSSGSWTLIRGWNKKLKKTDPDAPLRAGTKVILK